ncbi:MAG: anti-sigma regulatory factor [Chloroflexota bacterium]|nr:anti-sigma regulatory factor [Chloroflexota bacterium]
MRATSIVIEVREEGDIVRARRAGRDLASELGFRSVDQSRIATAISELARNILNYASTGQIQIHPLPQDRGIEIIAQDEGPGIADVTRALQDGYTSGRGLGIGLPGTKRLVDEMELDSTLGRGTRVTVRKWLRKSL